MIKPSTRRTFVRNTFFTTLGSALFTSTYAFSNNTDKTSNYIDCRDSIFSSKVVSIDGTIYRKDGKTPAPNVILEFRHLSPNSKRYSHKGIIQTNENGEYKIITDFPNKEKGKHARIHFKVKDVIAYETELLISKNQALITHKHWERNNKLGEKMFPTKQQSGNRHSVTFNLSI